MPRVGLLDHLEATSGTPVAAIIAPPGYGKTTVLTQWAEHDPRPFGWLTIDQRHNDPAVLLRSMAVALQLVDAVAHPPLSALGSPGPSVMETLLPQLGAALSASHRPAVLVLDDVHLLQNWDCLEAVASLIEFLPPGSQFAIAGRGEPPLPFARLRAEGRVVELGAGDLAMDRQEAGSLLEGTQVDVSQVDVSELVRMTEGWPVALHFAACSLRSGSGRRVAVADRFLADYLQFTVLSSLPEWLVSFLTRAAVLDQLSGPLCDAVLERTGSASLLETLERSSLLVIPLDRRRQWYRLHPLFRKLLRARLERREPALAGELAGRAAEWYERNHLPERAIEYAMAAGDRDRAERLVVDVALPMYQAGRTAVLRRWFDWFETSGPAGPSVELAVLGAWLSALAGRPAAAERWADAAARASSGEPSPDGGTRSTAGGPCSGRPCAATGRSGCGPTPRPPWRSCRRPAGGGRRPSSCSASRTCWPGTWTPPIGPWPTRPSWGRTPVPTPPPWPWPSRLWWRSPGVPGRRPRRWPSGPVRRPAACGWSST